MGDARIVVVGSTMIDLVAYADRLPGDGETVVGSSYVTGFGGKGANQAVMAARLGAEVAMVNTLGEDDHGTAYLGQFAAEGIDTTFIRRVPGSSGVAPIWVDRAGTNRIIIVPGANLQVRPDVAAEAVETVRPTGRDRAVRDPAGDDRGRVRRRAHARCHDRPEPGTGRPGRPGAARCDGLAGAERDGVRADRRGPAGGDGRGPGRGGSARSPTRLGVSVVVTLGERGALVVPRGGTSSRVEAPRVEAVDTTGAGDAFVGAFAVGLALGRSVEGAVRLGCVAAADSVTRRGTQALLPGQGRGNPHPGRDRPVGCRHDGRGRPRTRPRWPGRHARLRSAVDDRPDRARAHGRREHRRDRPGLRAARRPEPRLRRRGRRDPRPRLGGGPVDRAPRIAHRAAGRRHPQRDVRQHRRADHRLLRPAGRSHRGRQGVDHRVDHRQPAARPRREHPARRAAPRDTDVQPADRGVQCLAAGAGRHRAVRARRVRLQHQ